MRIPSDITQVASMPSNIITQLCLSSDSAAVGTREGVVVAFDRRGPNGGWMRRQEVAVDGGVESLCLETGMSEAVCAR